MASVVAKKAARPLDILRRLQGGPYTTEEFCDLYGVSARAVSRDLLDLRTEPFCLPIEQAYTVERRYGMETLASSSSGRR